MLNKEQKQITGDIGSNFQVGDDAKINYITVFNQGVSYEDIRKIIDERMQEFIDKFLKELEMKNPEGIKQAIDPDFQYDILIAKRDFARCGDPRLADILITLLVERSNETQRSRAQIVLNESIAVASKLTREEYDILTLWFVSQYIAKNQEFHSISDLENFIETYILPFLDSFNKEKSWHTHLVYAGCGFIQAFQVMDIDMIIHSKSAKIIPEGFKNIYGYLVSEYPGIDLLLRIKEQYYNEALEMKMDKPESCMSLTSVGIAIGYANLCRVTGEEYNLSNWI